MTYMFVQGVLLDQSCVHQVKFLVDTHTNELFNIFVCAFMKVIFVSRKETN